MGCLRGMAIGQTQVKRWREINRIRPNRQRKKGNPIQLLQQHWVEATQGMYSRTNSSSFFHFVYHLVQATIAQIKLDLPRNVTFFCERQNTVTSLYIAVYSVPLLRRLFVSVVVTTMSKSLTASIRMTAMEASAKKHNQVTMGQMRCGACFPDFVRCSTEHLAVYIRYNIRTL